MTQDHQLEFSINKNTQSDFYGEFTLEPLERGYGTTVANSMRRILMTSIPGAAITSVRIDGTLHEFSTIEGVVEEVTDIIQNLKDVRFELEDNQPDKVELSFNGSSKFTAKDIDEASEQFNVLNPDLHIATVNEDANFTMELSIGVGKGYVSATHHQRIDPSIDTIFIDSIFNPVTKVRFEVLPVTLGNETMEKVILNVNTDGSTSPVDAVNHAAKVLIDFFRHFLIEKAAPVLRITHEFDEENLRIRELLSRNIDDMELSVRSHNCLQAAGIKSMKDLVSKEESEMLKYKNFGRKSLSELIEKLSEMNLSFGMDIEKFMLDSDNGAQLHAASETN